MIYFLRHHITANNQSGYISGQSDSPILKDCIDVESMDIPDNIDEIYTSPSQRCIDTLLSISKLSATPTIDHRLLERNMGVFEKRERKDLAIEYPAFFWTTGSKPYFRFECTPPNGESLAEFTNRISSFCDDVLIPYKDRNVLVCSHNQAMKMIYFLMIGIKPTEKSWQHLHFPNGKCIPFPSVIIEDELRNATK